MLDKYTKEWNLSVNLDNTEIIVFRKGGSLTFKERWYLNGKQINVVKGYKYLGIFLIQH